MKTIHLLVIIFLIHVHRIESQTPNGQSQNSVNRKPTSSLHQSEECQSDINRYCSTDNSNFSPKRLLTNIQVLQCIYNNVADYNSIDKKCQNVSIISKDILLKIYILFNLKSIHLFQF